MKKIFWLILVLCGFVLNLQAQRSPVVELSKYVPEEVIEQSNEEGIPLLSTNMQTYEVVGKLYNILNA